MRLLPGQTHLLRRLVRACGSGACQLPTQHGSEGSLLSRCFGDTVLSTWVGSIVCGSAGCLPRTSALVPAQRVCREHRETELRDELES